MVVTVILVVIFVLLLFIKMRSRRMRIAVVTGYALSIVSFLTFIIMAFSTQQEILWVLLGVFYVSIIAFLVLWNLKKTKLVYWILAVPALCIVSVMVVIKYDDYAQKIPTVEESNFYLYDYQPFREKNLLAKLDEESSLKIVDNLPILDGATALFPVYASFVQAVYPEDKYEISAGYDYGFSLVNCKGTGKAYENLLEGKADIIFCAGPSDAQTQQFIDNGLKLREVPIGREAFVFFVYARNPVNNVTTEDIRRIYSGKIKNWKKLNGKYQSIKAFQRPKDSGSQTMLEKIMGGVPLMKPRMENVYEGMLEIISQVAVYRNFSNAIGYSFLFFTTKMAKNDYIKLLSIEGVYPSKETIQNNRYPFADHFYAIYIDNDKKNENTEAFIEWMLSEQGQELIQKTGYVPVR